MEEVRIKSKEFKIIPENRLVHGSMPMKWIERDMKKGIKPLYKLIIKLVFSFVYPDETLVGGTVFANAYCDEKDVFNDKTGIDVCSAKLEYKNHMRLAKAFLRVCDIFYDCAEIASRFSREHVGKARAIEHDLEKTYGRLPL